MKNKTEIMKSVSSVANKTVMKLKKHSPEILVVAGVVGAVASAVIACKATTKVGKITEEAKDMIDAIHKSEKNGVTPAGETYTKEDCQKDLAITYVQTGIKYAKLYAPAVILGSLSITSILASNNILRKRNVALGAAYRNVTLVAGEGEGTARKTTVVGSGSGLNRREVFTDARDISSETEDGVTLSDTEYYAQLRSKGLKTLADHPITTAFEGEVEVTRLFKYGEDFFIGDIVQIANEYGNEGSAYISELIISRSEAGLSVYPTFKTISKKEG